MFMFVYLKSIVKVVFSQIIMYKLGLVSGSKDQRFRIKMKIKVYFRTKLVTDDVNMIPVYRFSYL